MGTMLSDVSSYLKNPIPYNNDGRQEGVQRRRGAVSGGPRARLESVEQHHVHNSGRGGVRFDNNMIEVNRIDHNMDGNRVGSSG